MKIPIALVRRGVECKFVWNLKGFWLSSTAPFLVAIGRVRANELGRSSLGTIASLIIHPPIPSPTVLMMRVAGLNRADFEEAVANAKG